MKGKRQVSVESWLENSKSSESGTYHPIEREWQICHPIRSQDSQPPVWSPLMKTKLSTGQPNMGHVIIGVDVVGLYSSLEAEISGEAVWEKAIKTEGVDWKEALRYVAINCDRFEDRKMGIEHLLPISKLKNAKTNHQR